VQPPAVAGGGGHTDGSVRLSKRMSELGLASRREADEWIARGWVRVDGRVVSELGSRVVEGQRITIDAPAKQAQAQLVTVLVNKPVGFVSGQAEDGYQPARVLVTREKQWREDRSAIHFTPQHLRSLRLLNSRSSIGMNMHALLSRPLDDDDEVVDDEDFDDEVQRDEDEAAEEADDEDDEDEDDDEEAETWQVLAVSSGLTS